LVTELQPVAHLDLGAEVARDVDLAQMRNAVLNHRHTHTVLIEDDGAGGDHNRGGLARDVQLIKRNSFYAII
jgi:hypothetical protein